MIPPSIAPLEPARRRAGLPPLRGPGLPLLVLACTLVAPAALQAQAKAPAKPAADKTPAALSETLKKVSARYARTDARVAELVGRRLNPQPLPAKLPNPFYHGVELSELTNPEPAPELAPAAPDISDADTLARLAPTLRISGLVIRDQKPHLIINSIVCKAGDLFPVTGGDTPVFLQVRKIANDAFTLGLNDAELTIPLKL